MGNAISSLVPEQGPLRFSTRAAGVAPFLPTQCPLPLSQKVTPVIMVDGGDKNDDDSDGRRTREMFVREMRSAVPHVVGGHTGYGETRKERKPAPARAGCMHQSSRETEKEAMKS